MRVVFWAEAGRQIGSGHIMRLLPLVDAFKAIAFEISLVFEIHDLPWLDTYLTDNEYSRFLTDASEIFPSSENDILVFDSYTSPMLNNFFLKSRWRFLTVIVDSETPQFDADLYVHPGLTTTSLSWPGDRLIFGIEYSLIRSSLEILSRNREEAPRREIDYVMIAGGGSDPNHFVDALTRHLRTRFPDLYLHTFGGSYATSEPDNLVFRHAIGPDLGKCLANASKAFLPSSTMVFESLALGVPTAIAKCVDNQKENYDELSRLGLATGIGSWDQFFGWNFNDEAIALFLDEPNGALGSQTSQIQKIDFFGARRVRDEIIRRIETQIPD